MEEIKETQEQDHSEEVVKHLNKALARDINIFDSEFLKELKEE